MVKLLYVGAGGFFGSIFRYTISQLFQYFYSHQLIPYATLVVNFLGCFLIGIMMGLFEYNKIFNPEIRLFFVIGFLGGFTTFSSFSYEIFSSIRGGHHIQALFIFLLHTLLGYCAVWGGFKIIQFSQ